MGGGVRALGRALRLLVSGAIRPLFWLVVLAVVGHHLFMAARCVDDMTKAYLSSWISGVLGLAADKAECAQSLFVQPKGVLTLSTPPLLDGQLSGSHRDPFR